MNNGKVVVAGGGLIGCAVAWRLAQRGAQVTVVESSRPGTAASWAAAGMLAPLTEAHHVALRTLATDSIALFPKFVEELRDACGIDAELQLTGKLDVAFNDDEMTQARARYGSQLPDEVRELTAAEAMDFEPHLAPQVVGAIHSRSAGSVDNRKLTRAAWLAAAAAGVEFCNGASVREVLCSRGAFEAVYLSTGERIEADALIVCAGAWSSSIRGLPLALPVFPVRGQMIALECVPSLVKRVLMTERCYIVPRSDGRVLIGSTVERVGFDARTTAGGIAYLLESAIQVVPMLADANVIETWAGLRPGTPDGLPILGADPRAPGVFYATGHFRNGILLAPITADMMARAVVDSATPNIASFAVNRFHE